jgi:hypothetical protein
MKKCNFYVLVLVSIVLPLVAQSQKLRLGAHVGLTSARMLWDGKNNENPNGFFQFPITQFRQSFCVGLSGDLKFSNRFYSPIQLDLINRRFSISSGGSVLFMNENGQWSIAKADYLDYRLLQVGISGGIGYKITNSLALELQPYYQASIKDQEVQVKDIISWRAEPGFQQYYDVGLSGYLRFNVRDIYLKCGYQYGLIAHQEYSAVDTSGAPIGKFPIRNTMLLLMAGYQF